ncbi:ACP S-malonyltransferase [Ammoniphilus sp. YIM 78166]|uniref:ACP S-malonyltransferase n=1 Tax=Ammoniphilus sp. YIM 78166 TaxID=1644106 RepID=UPI0010706987|nr:ACP S-malonyltransferase [Ammoniphilus sp. YIM 78166]
MAKVALIFPGQGSQYVGMGKEALEKSSAAAAVFAKADKALGLPLTQLCLEGPEEQLKLTVNTQPAILTTSVALLEWLREKQAITPAFVAGHSLGEYSALVAAGALSFEDAVVAVRARGQYMEEAVPAGVGAMAAILGMDRDKLHAICEEISSNGTPVQLANLNSPGQIVISGSAEGVGAASDEAKKQGAKRAIPLNVSGPFHSSLLQPASEQLKSKLSGISISDASVPVVANVSARELTKAEDIFTSLVEQVSSPVLWEDSVMYMSEQGVDTYIEVGPGTVLAGLVKKIDRNAKVFSVQDEASLNKLISEWV